MVRKFNFFTLNSKCDWAAAAADAAKRNGMEWDAAQAVWSPVRVQEAKRGSSLADTGDHGNNEGEEGMEDVERVFFDAIAIGQQGNPPDARGAERLLLSFLVEKRRQVGVAPLRCRKKG